jgi:preprotein translocase subunit SecF
LPVEAMNARQVTESTAFLTIARLSMIVTPILFGATMLVGAGWLNNRFEIVGSATASLREDVNEQQTESQALKERMRAVEINETRGREDREEFQRQTTAQLQQIMEQLGILSNGFASLAATIEAQQRQIDRR